MAVDTAQKRHSATLLLMPFRDACFPSVAGIVAVERQAAAWIYSGIAASVVVVRPLFNFIANTKTFAFTARLKTFAFTATARVFNSTAKTGPI